MNENQRAAFIMSQVACAQAKIAGMQAENMQRQALGQSMAYVENDFVGLDKEFMIGWNDVIAHFRD